MVYQSLRMYGTTIVFPETAKYIAHEVISQKLKPITEQIERHENYHVYSKSFTSANDITHDFTRTNIDPFLHGYSLRSGCCGKLAQLIYRIAEFFKGLFTGKSDKKIALRYLENLVAEKYNITRKNPQRTILSSYTSAVQKEAGEILNDLLNDYNKSLRQ